MRNRILKRPMFRMGGSTEGIMSGLDTPTLEASRQGYSRGADVRQRVETIRGIYDDILPERDRRGMPGSVSNLLTGFGLNLLAQPGGQNIFQTAAKAAQTPYQQFVASRQRERDEDRALTQAIIGDAIEQESDEEIARLKREKKTYEFEGKDRLLGDLQKTQDENLAKIKEIDKQFESDAKELSTILQKEQEGEEIDVVRRDFLQKRQKEGKNKERKQLIRENEKLEQRISNLGTGETRQQRQLRLAEERGDISPEEYRIYQETGKVPAGYAEGGEVEVDSPTMSRVSAINYDTLRARLPKEIGDDIVKLISDSNRALTDFANIRTQQDVDQFNQAYNVNLVLPAEE
mgnify:CR=1 FL=1